MRRARCAIYIRQARRVLQSLDDDTLKDIGLTRFDAWRASNRALLFKLVRHRVDWSASRRNRVRNDVDAPSKVASCFQMSTLRDALGGSAKANIESTSHFLFVRPTALAKSRRSVATRRSSGCQPEVFRLAAISIPVPTTSMSALVKSRQVQCNRHVRFTPESDIDCVFQNVH